MKIIAIIITIKENNNDVQQSKSSCAATDYQGVIEASTNCVKAIRHMMTTSTRKSYQMNENINIAYINVTVAVYDDIFKTK